MTEELTLKVLKQLDENGGEVKDSRVISDDATLMAGILRSLAGRRVY